MPIIDGAWVSPSSMIAALGLSTYEQEYGDGYNGPNKALKGKEDTQMSASVMEAKEGFKFGCDPEGFILNTLTGKHVSAEGLIPGTKAEPYKVKYGAVQVDGMAAEFNIDPADNFKDFNRNIQAVINQLQKMLPEGHVLDFIPSVNFDPEIFNTSPDKAKELGCSPDFNAWTSEVNPPPNAPNNPFLRTASGHLHISWPGGPYDLTDMQHIMNCNDLVKQFDWYLGGWSVKIDSDPTRRQLYGRAGACRYKNYGVEYRVLSNFWVTTRERRLAVWNRMQIAINAMSKMFMPEAVISFHNSMLQNGINESLIPPELIQSYKYPLVTTEETVTSGRRIRGYKMQPFVSGSNSI